MDILVFKTNLTNRNRIRAITSQLDEHPNIHRWNVDLQDCDNILRIETEKLCGTEIENLLLDAGYYCKELE